MQEIDQVANCIVEHFCCHAPFADYEKLIRDFAKAARETAETMKKDPIIFEVWPRFVALGEALKAFKPAATGESDQMTRMRTAYGRELIHEGARLIAYIAGARVPMPASTKRYIAKCERYHQN